MGRITRYKSLFPKSYNLVEDDDDLFLLHCHYYKKLDQLFIIYKRYSTGEKILKVIEEPQVPIFIAKSQPKRHREYIETSKCNRYMVSYKNKKEEVKELLFDYQTIKFKDKKTGRTVMKKYFPDIPKWTEVLHPSLFFYDVNIEQIVYMEYTMNRYSQRDGLLYEDVKIPKINFGAFDIETSYWKDRKEWTINTNTFVCQQTMIAYLDYVKMYEHFNRQQYLTEHKEEFIQDVRNVMEKAIAGSTISDKNTREKVQAMCREFMKNLNFKIRDFNSESELIMETTKTMFTTHSPDILMAYNTTYDIGMFNERIQKLKLPAGTMNQRFKEYFDVLPPYAEDGNIDKNGKFLGDVSQPKKRKVYLNNISHTMISDLQTCYYSMRQGSVYADYKLNSLATMVLGFGKFDYSHITNDILKLAEKDFWTHSVYALCDSIILLMINMVGNDFVSKLNYCMRSKCNIEETSQSNSTITRSFHTDAYIYKDCIAGNNIAKVLKKMTREEVKDVSRALKIDLIPNYNDIVYRSKFGGGIVSDPNLYKFDPFIYKHHNVLNNEAVLSDFRKLENLVYLDFKSHYPSTFITRNISKGTLRGKLAYIKSKYDGRVLKTIDKKYKDDPIFTNHMGTITLAMANKDIISYGSKVMNLPTTEELANIFLTQDSEPLHSKPRIPMIEVPLKKMKKLTSVLSKINRSRYTKTDANADNPDNGLFFFNNGVMRYHGTLVEYNYPNESLLDYTISETGQSYSQNDGTPFYGKAYKGNLVSMNHMINKARAPKFDMNSAEWYDLPKDYYQLIENTDLFSKKISFPGGLDIIMIDICLYYPFKFKNKQDETKINTDKNPYISDLKYRFIKLEETTKVEFFYTITYLSVVVEITQQMQIVNL